MHTSGLLNMERGKVAREEGVHRATHTPEMEDEGARRVCARERKRPSARGLGSLRELMLIGLFSI